MHTKMQRDGKFADVHPDEVDHMLKHDWRIVSDPIPTREDIAKMPKAETVEWLTAHGVDDPKGKVGDLRAVLTEIIYTEV